MKRITYLLFTFFLISATSIKAQSFRREAKIKTHLGLNAGYSVSSTCNDQNSSCYKPYKNFNSGLLFELQFTDNFVISTQANLLKKGFQIEERNALSTTDYTGEQSYIATNNETQLKYLQVPLMLKFQYGNNAKLYFAFGVYWSHLLSSNSTENIHTFVSDNEYDLFNDTELELGHYNRTNELGDVSKNFTSSDYGLAFSAGFQPQLSKRVHLLFKTDYFRGLNNINAIPSNAEDISDTSLKNSTFNFNFGILVKINSDKRYYR